MKLPGYLKPSLEEIEAQIKRLGREDILGVREIKELPNILLGGEVIKKLARGRGILVATNRRLIYAKSSWGTLDVIQSFSYDKISSVQYEPGGLEGARITVYTEPTIAYIEEVTSQQALEFCNYVTALIFGSEQSEGTQEEC